MWIRIDDQFPDHPKIRSVGAFGAALQVAAICYCGKHLTDGFLPFSVADALISAQSSKFTIPEAKAEAYPEASFDENSWRPQKVWTPGFTCGMVGRDAIEMPWHLIMVAARLWDPCDGGYKVHDYLVYNPSREEVLKKHEALSEAGKRGAKSRESRKPTVQESKPALKPTLKPALKPALKPTIKPFASTTPLKNNHNFSSSESGEERESSEQREEENDPNVQNDGKIAAPPVPDIPARVLEIMHRIADRTGLEAYRMSEIGYHSDLLRAGQRVGFACLLREAERFEQWIIGEVESGRIKANATRPNPRTRFFNNWLGKVDPQFFTTGDSPSVATDEHNPYAEYFEQQVRKSQ